MPIYRIEYESREIVSHFVEVEADSEMQAEDEFDILYSSRPDDEIVNVVLLDE